MTLNLSLKDIRIREDFRRDGLAANFLADFNMIRSFSRAFPTSLINIGYPSVCNSEFLICKEILEKCADVPSELAVVCHARRSDLRQLFDLCKKHHNISVNFWCPVSSQFLANTFRLSPENVLEHIKNLIFFWKKRTKIPIDIALTDCTVNESGLQDRVEYWVREIQKIGVRRVILCDTRGIGTPEKIYQMCRFLENIEYHPHNDNNQAIKNIKAAYAAGVRYFGCAMFGSGERLTMLDSREIMVPEDEYELQNFIRLYHKKIGDPQTVLNMVYSKGTSVTGSHLRLWGRPSEGEYIFGVTSDRFIVSNLLKRKINSSELRLLKDKYLYSQKNIILRAKELRRLIRLDKFKLEEINTCDNSAIL